MNRMNVNDGSPNFSKHSRESRPVEESRDSFKRPKPRGLAKTISRLSNCFLWLSM